MNVLRLVGPLLASALFGWVAVGAMIRIAPRFGLIDVPNARSLHGRTTPRGGGLVIAILGIGAAGAAAIGAGPAEQSELLGFMLGAALIAMISLLDDLRGVSIGLRIVIQLMGAAAGTIGLVVGRMEHQHDVGTQWMFLVVAVIWVVGLTNTYNFMDGIDGLAGSHGVTAGVAMAVMASRNSDGWVTAVAAAIAGASLGFVIWNWPPARIFMGDVGSAFLGFAFGMMILVVPRNFRELAGAVVVMWPMLFDEAVTMSARLVRRENVFVAHRSHIYQRLVLSGLPRGTVAATYAVFSIFSASVGLLIWMSTSYWQAIAGLCLLGLASLWITWLAISRERRAGRPEGHPRAHG